MADHRRVAVIVGAVVAVVAVFAIPVTRRLVGWAIVSLLVLGGCEVTIGSYTKRHCDAFREAFTSFDPSVGEELLALATPPEGETVEPAVHDAALLLVVALTGNDPVAEAEGEEALIAECAKVTE